MKSLIRYGTRADAFFPKYLHTKIERFFFAFYHKQFSLCAISARDFILRKFPIIVQACLSMRFCALEHTFFLYLCGILPSTPPPGGNRARGGVIHEGSGMKGGGELILSYIVWINY